jgi:hypothetical protein
MTLLTIIQYSFSLVNKEIEEISYKNTTKLYKDFESKAKDNPNNSLAYLREIFQFMSKFDLFLINGIINSFFCFKDRS